MDQRRTKSLGDNHTWLGYHSPPALAQVGRFTTPMPEASAQGRSEKDLGPSPQSVRRARESLAESDPPGAIPAQQSDAHTGVSAAAPPPNNAFDEPDPQSTAEVEVLRRADYLEAELLGTVSHELRNPLAVIKGYAATLLRHELSLEQAEKREFLTAIAEACDRLEVMVDQLLEMSQLETGTLVPKFMLMNAEYLVREAATALEDRLAGGSWGEHRVVLQVLGTERLPLVQADPRLLRDALDSVLENSLKFSPSGGTIAISLQVAPLPAATPSSVTDTPMASAEQGGAVVISVRDSGIGIFERFHRVDTGLTRQVNWLGLGLEICKRIVGLHGGLVWGESSLGEGSTFYLALPAAQEEDETSQNEIRST